MRPTVSVVMSVQDAGEYLAPTMESVLAQEGVDLELLAVDDGSADGSTDVLRGFAKGDRRVRVLRQERLGLTEALILGCSHARGPYIARQDAADLSRPTRLARQARALDADPELAFVSCWTEYRGPRMEYLFTTRDTGRARDPADVVVEEGGKPTLADGPTHHGSVMLRREVYERVGGYRREFYLAQDRDLWFRMAEAGRYQALPEALYVALVLPASRSASFRDVQHRLGRLARRAFELRQAGASEAPALELAAALRPRGSAHGARRIAAANYFIGEALRRNGDLRCLGYLGTAVRLRPLHAVGWLRLLQAGAGSTIGRWRAGPE
ncbi:MAG TPA: glycosyltransferase family A protein [Gemmatimonadota bacterium]|nr:glycosyltransferase family A protein [Gemmatimonadota bacterium]